MGVVVKMSDFSFNAAKANTQSDDPISIKDLAKELGVTEERIYGLVNNGYLKTIRLGVVGRPKEAGLVWLRQALGPVPFIPIIPVRYVGEMLGLTDKGRKKKARQLKELILDHNIVVYIDPVLGEMMTISGFHRLFNSLFPWHLRSRFDRGMFFCLLSGLDAGDGVRFVAPRPYSEALEAELARVAKLREPLKSIRSMEIFEAYRDAKTLASIINKAVKTPVQERVENIMRSMKRRMDRQYERQSSNSSSTSSATSTAGRSTVNPSVGP
jgi:hypothetical protein